MTAPSTFGELGLSIIGIGTEYPPYSLEHTCIDILSERFYPDTPSMRKNHPVVNQKNAPSISELHQLFHSDGVPLAIRAARKAIAEAKVDTRFITHIVATTCTDSANPGFDHFVAKGLGITHGVEKVLLHGVGCSGGLATLRTGANLALGHRARGLPARVLCVALEVSTTMVRSWDHRVIPDTENDLGFDVDPVGWKVVLTPRVPKLTRAAIAPAFNDLKASLPRLPPDYQTAADFDWAMHPGGATILTGAEQAMNITPEHMRASYDTYINHGNSSSATIFSVMDRLRSKDMDVISPGGRLREYVVGCAFGPGISVEMCMLKRNLGLGSSIVGIQTPPQTPPETESEPSEVGDGEWGPEMSGSSDGKDAVIEPRDQDAAFVAKALEHLDLD
ncbi:hypothetical protein CEP52_005991 [Fusarium oligoseptatum]|uniref:Uncharacterized protein n=1 Tax=Fusarium oligoseptatum TaxID=2604345 RepID=A0A428TV54_9HYPO|nr:hypothetical protein CEP52_005991 [Fusarium oligoseptatum]